MNDADLRQPRLVTTALAVTVVDGEIILNGAGSSAPSLTATAARETARRLLKAADILAPV